ncbi:MAG: hypothetical protein Q9160_006062 [Pyrenula sp. 1 TL-2023]
MACVEWLWVDAISIDQSSIHERNHQVQMMKTIFEEANCVYSWLGPETASTSWLFKRIRDIQDSASEKLPTEDSHPNDSISMRVRRFLTENKTTVRSGMLALCQNEYWARVWIVQEFVLARRNFLVCGALTMDFSLITDYIDIIRPLPQVKTMLTTKSKRLSNGHNLGFESYWYWHHAKSCTVLQDKVYALLGMSMGNCRDVFFNRSIIDYNQSSWHLLYQLLNLVVFDEPLRFIYSFTDQFGLTTSLINQKDIDDCRLNFVLDRNLTVVLHSAMRLHCRVSDLKTTKASQASPSETSVVSVVPITKLEPSGRAPDAEISPQNMSNLHFLCGHNTLPSPQPEILCLFTLTGRFHREKVVIITRSPDDSSTAHILGIQVDGLIDTQGQIGDSLRNRDALRECLQCFVKMSRIRNPWDCPCLETPFILFLQLLDMIRPLISPLRRPLTVKDDLCDAASLTEYADLSPWKQSKSKKYQPPLEQDERFSMGISAKL